MLQLQNKEEELDRVAAALEVDFEITGSTAIEDRLQEGVPEAILHIRKAGIKLWILTGDKIETAVNIGYSCGLLDAKLNQYIVDATNKADIFKQIAVAQNKQNLLIGKKSKQMGVIVAGDSLIKILDNDSLKRKFIDLIS